MTTVSDGLFIILHIILITVMAKGFREKAGDLAGMAWAYYPALFFKILMGLLLGLIYQYYYGAGDTMMLFQDAARLAQEAQHFLQYVRVMSDQTTLPDLYYGQNPRALFFAKCISPLAWFTQGNYWLTSIYVSLLGFFCSWYLCLALVKYYRHALAVAVSFLFYPSALFWSSGIIKESIAVSMISLIVAMMLHIVHQPTGLSSILRTGNRWRILVLLMCGAVLWQLKYYYAAVLFPLIVSSIFLYCVRLKSYQKLLATVSACGFLVLAISFLHPNLNATRILYALVATHDSMFEASDIGDVIHYGSLEPTWYGVGRNIPQALVAGLLRPLPGDGATLLHKIVQIENTLLLLCMIIAIYCLIKYKKPVAEKQLFFAMFIYIVTLATLLALSSPNFGTLMRYKAVYLPFLVYICMLGCSPLLNSATASFGLHKRLKSAQA